MKVEREPSPEAPVSAAGSASDSGDDSGDDDGDEAKLDNGCLILSLVSQNDSCGFVVSKIWKHSNKIPFRI